MSTLTIEDYQSDFCPKCGCLIDLDCLLSELTCPACKTKHKFNEFVGKPIKAHMTIQKEKDWVRKYTSMQSVKESRTKSKMTIKEQCPNCKHPELKYFTMQTRSADEGSTVFYECEKCQYSFSVNN